MITAVVLTKDEAINIQRCLNSLKWCDEIIIIDDNSEDGTIQLAKRLITRYVNRSLCNNFSSQRNFGLKEARNKWVFFVDADEEVSTELANEIQQAIKNIEFKGFRLHRHDYLWGRKLTHGDIGRFNYVRLGRKGAGQWQRKVDEIWEINGRVGQLKNPLIHYPHQTMTEFLEEINFKSSLNAEQLYDEGKKTRLVDWGKPLATFVRSWIIKGGFLDGMQGFNVALLMSLHSFLVRSKLYLLTKNSPIKSETHL